MKNEKIMLIVFVILILSIITIIYIKQPVSDCPNVDHIDCMPIVKPEFEEYCTPEKRSWIEKNCPHILITD